MSAKIRSMAIRPERDRRIIGTKMVMNTRNPRKKLRPLSSIQKGINVALLSFSIMPSIRPVPARIRRDLLGTANQQTSRKDQGAPDRHLSCGRYDRRVHVAVSNPSNDRELDQHDKKG